VYILSYIYFILTPDAATRLYYIIWNMIFELNAHDMHTVKCLMGIYLGVLTTSCFIIRGKLLFFFISSPLIISFSILKAVVKSQNFNYQAP
jgi:hypothetical protein